MRQFSLDVSLNSSPLSLLPKGRSLAVALGLFVPSLAVAEELGVGGLNSSGTVSLGAIEVLAPFGEALFESGFGVFEGRALAETPASVSLMNTRVLRDAGFSSLSAAFRAESAVSDSYNTFGYVESFSIRGFALDSLTGYRRDGLPISNHAPLALENKGEVGVLRGSPGFVSGGGSPGGSINFVPKKPTNRAFKELNTEISEWGSVLAHLDMGGRFSSDNRVGYRINIASQQRNAMYDQARGNRQLLSGYWDWKLSPSAILELDLEHHRLSQRSVPGYGLLDRDGDGVGETLPQRVPSTGNLNNQPWSSPFVNRAHTGAIKGRYQFDDQWSASLALSGQRIRTDDRIAFPDGCSSAAVFVYPGNCANGDVDLYDYRSLGERRSLVGLDLGINGGLSLAGYQHNIYLNTRAFRYAERGPDFQAYNYAGTTNIDAGGVVPEAAVASTPNVFRDLRQKEFALYDRIDFTPVWSFWGGVRHTAIERSSALSDGSQRTGIDQSFTTPWISLSAQIGRGFAFVSYGENVEYEVVPNRPAEFVNAGQVLPAVRAKQLEIGWKQRLEAGYWSLTAYQITRPYADDVNDAATGLLDRRSDLREQRHQGFELDGQWRLGRDWTLDTRMALSDARTTKAVTAEWVGERVPNLAPVSGSLQLGWKPQRVEGLNILNRLTGFDRKPVTRDGTVAIGGAAQWDLLVTYQFAKKGPILRFGIDNVTDEKYWREAPTQSWGGVYLFPAQARTYRLAMTVPL